MPPKRTKEKEDLTHGLKAAVFYTVANIIQEEELKLGVSCSQGFVAALTELVYAQAETLGSDLEAFAQHADRSRIQVEDVYLVCRNNVTLKALIEDEAKAFEGEIPGGKSDPPALKKVASIKSVSTTLATDVGEGGSTSSRPKPGRLLSKKK